MYDQTNHRQRVRERYAAENLDHFSPVHALELLLFYAIAQKDTKPVARELLNHFGSFHGVLEADREDLKNIPGVGEHVALYLNLLRDTCRYYQVDCARETDVLSTLEECGEYISRYFIGRTNETVYLLCMDAKGKVLCCKMLGEGDNVSINLPVRRVVELAIQMRATNVVLAHNHPSGVALPSKEDVDLTNRLAEMLEAVHIQLLDHVIVADNDYVSMFQSVKHGG